MINNYRYQVAVFFALIFMFSFNTAYGQKGSLGFGVRLGDPTGFTLKKYSTNKAWELSIGRSYYLGKYNYENGFYRVDKYNNKDYYKYRGYKNFAPLALQFHIMAQKPLAGINGLDIYYGLGPQLRYKRIEYWYDYKVDGRWRERYEYYSDIDLGLDGVLGLEYTISDVPLSIFVDATLFMEVYDDPFLPWLQAGLGFRYNLNAGSKKK